MTPYRERLTAPASWWIAAICFGLVWGWLMLVATTWPIAIVTMLLVSIAGMVAVRLYGSALIEVTTDGLSVGRATLSTEHLGAVRTLDRTEYRHRLGVGADVRAYLVTRPYLDHGLAAEVLDPLDPVPYWLVSTRHPQALAAALGHPDAGHALQNPPPFRHTIGGDTSGPAPAHDAIGDVPRGEEA